MSKWLPAIVTIAAIWGVVLPAFFVLSKDIRKVSTDIARLEGYIAGRFGGPGGTKELKEG